MKTQELHDVLSRLPIKGEAAFSNTRGKFQEKVKRRQLRYLRDYVADLKHILEDREEIRLAARGVSPFNSLEQLTAGAWIYYIKRCLLVLTDRRLLHFPSDYRYRPRDSVAQIRFQDIEQFKGKRRIRFRYKNGTREFFSRVRNGKRLAQLLKKSVATTASASSQHAGRQHLCPKCVAPLPKDRFTCPRCRFEFKRPGTAGLYSIFFPGGGYFYTRHPWLGVGDAVTELALIVITFVFLRDYFTSGGDLADLYVGLAAGAALTVEKMVSVYHGKRFTREFIPVERRFNRIPQEGQTARPNVIVYGDKYDDEKAIFY